MKRVITLLIIALFAAPALAAASSTIPSAIPLQPTILQLFTRVAALEAQEAALTSPATVACAALTSVATVKAGTPFTLAWGSVGAMSPSASSTQSMWTQDGAQSVTQQTPGIWAYNFTFYGVSGGTATCTANIKVTS